MGIIKVVENGINLLFYYEIIKKNSYNVKNVLLAKIVFNYYLLTCFHLTEPQSAS